ncbi:hypothetical protein BDZ97DRAFT_1927969 [Flammula alnicola]|nr:hypothetical protein BDZ97DRAFT_1927969 [Flammula alnicola]
MPRVPQPATTYEQRPHTTPTMGQGVKRGPPTPISCRYNAAGTKTTPRHRAWPPNTTAATRQGPHETRTRQATLATPPSPSLLPPGPIDLGVDATSPPPLTPRPRHPQ